MQRDESLKRIELNRREKQFIHEYWFTASQEMQAQLLSKKKYIDITKSDLEDLLGRLSGECNHCKSKVLAAELDELCERLESLLYPFAGY